MCGEMRPAWYARHFPLFNHPRFGITTYSLGDRRPVHFFLTLAIERSSGLVARPFQPHYSYCILDTLPSDSRDWLQGASTRLNARTS